MSNEKSLAIVEERTVDFYGDALLAVRADDGHVYVAVNPMCAALGIDPQAQRRRIGRHAILADALAGVAKLATPSEGKRSGGRQPTYALRVDLVPLWLSGIRASAVNEEIRPQLIRFQKEAGIVLWEAFQEGRLTTSDEELTQIANADPEVVEALQIARAVANMARAHLRLAAEVGGNRQRIEALEGVIMDPGRVVTNAQASQISQSVKAVAMALSKQTRRNEYGGVYGELYRRYAVSSYHLLPANKFEDAMGWLTEWLGEITTDGF